MRLFAILFAVLPCGTLAEGIVATPYAEAVQSLTSVVDFETPELETKRQNEPRHFKEQCAVFGESFLGQIVTLVRLDRDLHDGLSGAPIAPLAIAPPSTRWHLTRERLSHGRTVTLMGNGPRGFVQAGIGEGSIAVMFDIPQNMVALTYDAALPQEVQKGRGTMTIEFFDSSGSLIATRTEKLRHRGYRAYRTISGRDLIKGFSITNTDPGGIAIDDVHMRCETLPMS